MSLDLLEKEYQAVSIEMSNPFAKLGEYSLAKFRGFTQYTSTFTQKALAKIDVSHANGLYNNPPEVQTAIKEKQVQYTDLQPIHVYVPAFLKPKTKVLDFAMALRNDVKICESIIKGTPEELATIASGYLGNPARLKDPILITVPTPVGLSLIDIEKAIFAQRKVNAELLTSTGASTTRAFKDAFPRVNDYVQTNEIAVDINNFYKEFIDIVQDFVGRVNAANKELEKLLTKISSSDEYEVNGAVAEYLTKQSYRLALATEYFGATLYNAQIFLKSISDTNITLANALK